jgi:biopolymer transport protein TolQ
MNFLSLLFSASIFVQIMMIVMVSLSILSWAIILQKLFYFTQIDFFTNSFLKIFTDNSNFSALLKNTDKQLFTCSVGKMFHNGIREFGRINKVKATKTIDDNLIIENVQRSLTSTANEEMVHCDKHNAFLATIATVGPYLGLLGTVWGVMDSFMNIKTSTNLSQVAPGIAESLISTLMGLLLSIPSYVAYNYFQDKSNALFGKMSKFSDDFVNQLNNKILNSEL